MPNFRFNKGDRVRLRTDRADIYRRAFGGSEGVVKDRRVEDLGHHNMVFVVWDKDHWTYNGEEDMWAFEDHFDPASKKVASPPAEEIDVSITFEKDNDVPDKKPDFMSALRNLIDQYEGDQVDDSDEAEAGFDQMLEEAFEYAVGCEAVVIVGVRREESPVNPNDSLLITDAHSWYKTEESKLLLQAQLSQIGAHTHNQLAMQAIERVLEERRGQRDK